MGDAGTIGTILTAGVSLDVFSKNAADLVRIAAFAGFPTQELKLRCFRVSKGERVNVRTVERILSEMEREYSQESI